MHHKNISYPRLEYIDYKSNQDTQQAATLFSIPLVTFISLCSFSITGVSEIDFTRLGLSRNRG